MGTGKRRERHLRLVTNNDTPSAGDGVGTGPGRTPSAADIARSHELLREVEENLLEVFTLLDQG